MGLVSVHVLLDQKSFHIHYWNRCWYQICDLPFYRLSPYLAFTHVRMQQTVVDAKVDGSILEM